jgi:hypothetical protein
VHVAIDKARHHHAASSIDLVRLPRQDEVLHAPARANLLDQSVDDQNCAVLDESEVSEIGPAAGTGRAVQCEQLPGAAYQRDFRHYFCLDSTLDGYTRIK